MIYSIALRYIPEKEDAPLYLRKMVVARLTLCLWSNRHSGSVQIPQ